MKVAVVCLLFSVVSLVFGAGNSAYYAGTTVGSSTSGIPPSVSGSTCTTGSSTAPYVSQVVNLTADNVYTVTALFDDASIGNVFLSAYPAGVFNPSLPCAGAVFNSEANSGGAPHINVPTYFAAGSYLFVVQAGSSSSVGIFSFHVDPATAIGKTDTSSHQWLYSAGSDPFCSTYSSSAQGPFVYFSWVQAATGVFDINLISQNETDQDSYLYSSVFNASVAQLSFLQQGNDTDPVNPCDDLTANSTFLWATAADSVTRVSSGFGTGAVFASVTLHAGWTYTVVASTGYSYRYSSFAMTVSETKYFEIGANANFGIPVLHSTPATCVAGSTLKVWRAHVFPVLYPTYVVDTGPSGVGFDTISALYAGTNAGTADQVVPPSPCTGYLQTVDTGDVAPLSATGLVPGINYTAVVSTYNSGTPSNPLYTLYLYSGEYIGVPTSTTGVAVSTTGAVAGTTTGAVGTTTGHVSTTAAVGSTTAHATTAAHGNSTSANLHSSDSTQVIVSLFVVALAALF